MKYVFRLNRLLIQSLFACGMSLAVMSCGGKSGAGNSITVSSRVIDKKAYALGEEHAASLILCADDEGKLQDGLLDIRARITNIDSKLGRQSAVDYERGFTDYIRNNCDSLAKIIF